MKRLKAEDPISQLLQELLELWMIAMGVTIGDGCVIGGKSLVMKDIPPGSKAYGTPCRVVGSVSSGPSSTPS